MLRNGYRVYSIKALLIMVLCCGAHIAVGQTADEVWRDSATGLIWASKDNGTSVNMNGARDYCTKLRTGGFSDWRLPTIDELEGIFDKSSKKVFKTKGSIELSDSCALSGSTNNEGEVWSLCFSYGGRSLVRATGHGSAGRALCVRSGE